MQYPSVSPSMRAYLTMEHRRALIDEELAKYPEMCVPEMPGRLTAHLTRAIEIPTVPLPVVDDEAPTEAVEIYWGYDDPTVAMKRATDQNATIPMDLADILR